MSYLSDQKDVVIRWFRFIWFGRWHGIYVFKELSIVFNKSSRSSQSPKSTDLRVKFKFLSVVVVVSLSRGLVNRGCQAATETGFFLNKNASVKRQPTRN
jgi:hypothetical protein